MLNGILYYVFNYLLFNVLSELLNSRISYFIDNKYLNLNIILLAFLIITKFIIKYSFYTIALHNDIEEIKNDITIYVGDFITNVFSILVSGYLFVILGIIFGATIIGLPIYFNYCIFFMIYVLAIKKSGSGSAYTSLESISKSFSITKGMRFKILFVNTIIMTLCVLAIFYMPEEVIVNKLNISFLLKILIVDFILVYLLRIGFELDKIETKQFEEVQQKEMNRRFEEAKAKMSVDATTGVKK